MKIKNYTLILAVLMLSVMSCGKNGGPGPQGNKGDTGATGPTGATGSTGATGTANVIYSDWVTPSTYTQNTVFGLTHFDADITAAKITQAVLDNSVVLVFGKLDGYTATIWPTDQVSQLPISVNYMEGSTEYEDTWSAYVVVGKITIDFVNNNNLYAAISTAHQFRYVIIPGGVKAAAVINFHDYAQVKAAFNIKD